MMWQVEDMIQVEPVYLYSARIGDAEHIILALTRNDKGDIYIVAPRFVVERMGIPSLLDPGVGLVHEGVASFRLGTREYRGVAFRLGARVPVKVYAGVVQAILAHVYNTRVRVLEPGMLVAAYSLDHDPGEGKAEAPP